MPRLHAFDLVLERGFSARAGLIGANPFGQSRLNALCVCFGYARGMLFQAILMQDQFRNLPLIICIEADLRANHRCKKLCFTFGKKLDIDLPGQTREKMIAVPDDGGDRGGSQLVIANVFVKVRGIEWHRIARACLF